MTITFQFTFKEYYETVLRASVGTRLLMIIGVGGLVLLAVAALFFGIVGWPKWFVFDWTFFLVPVVILMFWAGIIPLQAWLNWKRNAPLRGELTYDFQPEGVQVVTTTSNSFMKWEAFIKSKETPNLFLLFLTKQMCHMVPKRAFASEADLESLRVLLSEKIGKR